MKVFVSDIDTSLNFFNVTLIAEDEAGKEANILIDKEEVAQFICSKHWDSYQEGMDEDIDEDGNNFSFFSMSQWNTQEYLEKRIAVMTDYAKNNLTEYEIEWV